MATPPLEAEEDGWLGRRRFASNAADREVVTLCRLRPATEPAIPKAVPRSPLAAIASAAECSSAGATWAYRLTVERSAWPRYAATRRASPVLCRSQVAAV